MVITSLESLRLIEYKTRIACEFGRQKRRGEFEGSDFELWKMNEY
jgi:hypothetical protein